MLKSRIGIADKRLKTLVDNLGKIMRTYRNEKEMENVEEHLRDIK